jgi:hypothetical protein
MLSSALCYGHGQCGFGRRLQQQRCLLDVLSAANASEHTPQCSLNPNSITPGTPATLTIGVLGGQCGNSANEQRRPSSRLFCYATVFVRRSKLGSCRNIASLTMSAVSRGDFTPTIGDALPRGGPSLPNLVPLLLKRNSTPARPLDRKLLGNPTSIARPRLLNIQCRVGPTV